MDAEEEEVDVMEEEEADVVADAEEEEVDVTEEGESLFPSVNEPMCDLNGAFVAG